MSSACVQGEDVFPLSPNDDACISCAIKMDTYVKCSAATDSGQLLILLWYLDDRP